MKFEPAKTVIYALSYGRAFCNPTVVNITTTTTLPISVVMCVSVLSLEQPFYYGTELKVGGGIYLIYVNGLVTPGKP